MIVLNQTEIRISRYQNFKIVDLYVKIYQISTASLWNSTTLIMLIASQFVSKKTKYLTIHLNRAHIGWWSAKRLHTKSRPFRTKRTRFSRDRLTNLELDALNKIGRIHVQKFARPGGTFLKPTGLCLDFLTYWDFTLN